MSNETKNTKEISNVVENANAKANAQTMQPQTFEPEPQEAQFYEPKTYKRTITGAKFDSKTNAVFLRLDEPFYKGDEKFDSFGKSVNKLCESGAHPLFILVVKKGIKPVESVCLFIGAQIRFDVLFVRSGEVIDGYTIDTDGWIVTNVKIAENQPSEYFIEAAKEEKNAVSTL